MSRSYKHHPVLKEYGRRYTKWAKRQANKKVRRTQDISNGSLYKKVYQQYKIRDWISWCPLEWWREDKWLLDNSDKAWKKYYFWK